MPQEITIHLDAGYDSADTRDLLDELGCDGVISKKGFPRQAVGDRTNQLLAQPRLQEARDLHRTTSPRHRCLHRPGKRAVILTRRLLTQAWLAYRWDTPPGTPPMTY